mgnify:CR=1 FL=1
MSTDLTFTIKSTSLDENYHPSNNTRITTNFANLARGESRQQNLRNTLKMINNRFNALASWDNPQRDRYEVELKIISVDLDIAGSGKVFPSIEVLKTNIIDRQTNEQFEGMVGNNFSSYVRDYDFSVLLLEHNKSKPQFSIPDNFGDLHGKLFKCFVNSTTYKQHFKKPPVICLSVSDNKTYQQTENLHPILGVEYQPNESSLTDAIPSRNPHHRPQALHFKHIQETLFRFSQTPSFSAVCDRGDYNLHLCCKKTTTQ